jgi:hypothetical protein
MGNTRLFSISGADYQASGCSFHPDNFSPETYPKIRKSPQFEWPFDDLWITMALVYKDGEEVQFGLSIAKVRKGEKEFFS